MTRRRYHLSSDVDIRGELPPDARTAVPAALLRAVAQAVGNATPGDVAMAGPTRPLAREPWRSDREWPGGDSYAVPSYDKDGRPVPVPVRGGSGGPAVAPTRFPGGTVDHDVEVARTDLFGLEHVFAAYLRWRSLRTATYAEMMPVRAEWVIYAYGPRQAGGQAADFQDALAANGIPTSVEFELLVERFLMAFEHATVRLAFGLLGRYETLLRTEFARFGEPGAAAAIAPIGPAATALYRTFRKKEFHAVQRGINPGGPAPSTTDERDLVERMHAEARSAQAAADELVNNAAQSPVVAARDFDRAALARAAPTDMRGLIREYISQHLDSINETRQTLLHDHTFVYQLPDLIERSLQQLDIGPASVYRQIVDDRVAQVKSENAARQIALAVLALAIGLATGGTGAVAILGATALAGLGTYQAVEAYREYTRMHAAYEAQLIANDPSIAWVVVAVIAAGIDFTVLASALTPAVRAALTAFSKSRNARRAEQLAEDLTAAGTPSAVVNAIMPAARVEAGLGSMTAEAAQVLAGLGGGSPEELARIVHLVWVADRRGVTTLDRFVAQLRADRLLAEGELTETEAAMLREAFGHARAAVDRLNAAARSVRMPDSKLADVLDAWVAAPGHSVADVEQLILIGGSRSIAELETLTLDQLRELAKTHPDALTELVARYRRMSFEELQELVRRKDQLAKVVQQQENKVLEDWAHGARGEKHNLPHEATAKVIESDGTMRDLDPLTSGGHSAEGDALPRSQWRLKNWFTHTERRAVAEAKLRPGETLQITGTYNPCSLCMGYMREMSHGNRRIVYQWQGGRFEAFDGVTLRSE